MRTEQEARNSPDNTEEKIMRVLEHFLSLHEATEIYDMISDPQCEVSDVDAMLENYEDENYVNPNE